MKSKPITSYVIKNQNGDIVDVIVGTTPRNELIKLRTHGFMVKRTKLTREQASALRES